MRTYGNFPLRAAKLIKNGRLVLFPRRREAHKTPWQFSSEKCVHVTPFPNLSCIIVAVWKCVLTKKKKKKHVGVVRKAWNFLMSSSKFRMNQREVDYHLLTFLQSNCHETVFFLNGALAEFKANPVQRKSDLNFTQSGLNVIMPKSSWLAPHPLRYSRSRALASFKTLFSPSRRISRRSGSGSLPLAPAGCSTKKRASCLSYSQGSDHPETGFKSGY